MENLNWLEWDTETTLSIIDIIQRGAFPEQIDKIEVIREESLNLVAVGKGMGFYSLAEDIILQAGEWASLENDTVGRTKSGALVKLKGVVLIHSSDKTILRENTRQLTIHAKINEIEVIKSDLPIVSQIEWIVNFSTDKYFPLGRTKRIHSSSLKIERSGCSSIEFTLNESQNHRLDYFRCECTLDNQKWSLIVGCVVDEVAPVKYKPGFIEFENIDNNSLPSENIKQRIIMSLSFALGRQLISVGSTLLGKGSNCIGFTSKGIHILENKAYSQPSMPPMLLGLSLKEDFLDEEKISKIISCVATKMKAINIGHSLSLVYLGFASPLDVQAAHLGAAIESLRDAYCVGDNKLSTVLVSKDIWEKNIVKPLIEAFNNIMEAVDEDNIDINNLNILRQKLKQLNSKSSNMKYEDFFSLLSLKVGKVEKEALKERNNPAHGHFYDFSDYPKLLMIINALYSLFNRLILKITEASDCYIDYSTYGYPVRDINHPLGGIEDGENLTTEPRA